MLITKTLATAVVLASSSTAFFPWFPDYLCVEDHSCVAGRSVVDQEPAEASLKLVQRVPKSDLPHEVQILRLAERLTRKYQRGTAVQPIEVKERDVVAKRTNAYKIMPAAPPTQPMSAPIDQDGTDFSYFTEVVLGSSKTLVYMLLDTGAATTWVMGKSCASGPCKVHNTFDPASSTSFKDAGKAFNISYGSGQVGGSLGTDMISFAGMSFAMTLGIAESTSDDFNSFPIDGILGLSQSKGAYPIFLETLVESKSLKSNVFGVSLNRASDGTNTGEINFGEPNTSKYSGSLNYNDVSRDAGGDWAIPLSNVGVGTTQANIKSRLAFVDTGTSFIFCPPEDARLLYALVPGAETTNNVTYNIPCTTSTSLTFTFGSTTYNVDPKDWVSPMANGVCTGNIYGQAVTPGNWLLGDTFLKNVYSVFDADKDRIGFAQNNPGAATVSSTLTVSSSSASSTGMATSSTGSGITSATMTPSSSNGTPAGMAPSPVSGSSNAGVPTTTTTGPGSSSTSSGAPSPVSPGLGGHETSETDLAAQTQPSTTSPTSSPKSKSGARRLLTTFLPATFVLILVTLIT
ncbi:related to aspartic proteinase, pepstatin-sensitive [Rhynchosporium secalis]|uniref:Related to aspartic proteinase, pepstatin-sensitive n=1 Tax=Rhynchosporium secalis TaxID=38038 RepID=A0A1E1M7V9_RHYSE|nr:related to aspartic proteinase, pepstatin-sensitive [Rhynchosporium secalis]